MYRDHDFPSAKLGRGSALRRTVTGFTTRISRGLRRRNDIYHALAIFTCADEFHASVTPRIVGDAVAFTCPADSVARLITTTASVVRHRFLRNTDCGGTKIVT